MSLYVGEEMTHSLNRLAGTLDDKGQATLDAQGAANKWAGTKSLDLLGALNVVNHTWGLGLNAVCDQIMGSALDAQGALASGPTIGSEPWGTGAWGGTVAGELWGAGSWDGGWG